MIRLLARLKVYAQRGLQYVAFIQAAMVLDLWLKGKGVSHAYYWPALAGGGALLILWGYLERRIGLAEAETEYIWSQSPQLRQLVAALDDSAERGDAP